MKFREYVPLAPFTSFKIGGPARWFVEAGTAEEMVTAATFARERGLKLFILGGGSNLLVADRGFDGLVIRLSSTGIQERSDERGYRRFSVAAGESWDNFVSHAVSQDCGGIECLAGIPGTVGGTPIQNVGAYGQEVSDTIAGLQLLDLSTLSIVNLEAIDCQFRYRQSIFNHQDYGRYIILTVDFELREHAPACIRYRDLANYFKNYSGKPDLAQTAAAVREIRRQKGMVLMDGDPDTQSAGSFFKNPVVSADRLAGIAGAVASPQTAIPQYAAGADLIKIPAAWLVERAGITKGLQRGNAAVSSRHTLALTNKGGATAAEILALSSEITDRVAQMFAVELQLEPILVGF